MANTPEEKSWDGSGWGSPGHSRHATGGGSWSDTSPGDPRWASSGYPASASSSSRNGVVWALGALVVVLLVALAGVVGYFLASSGDEMPVTAPSPQEPVAPVVTSEPGGSPSPAPAPPDTQRSDGGQSAPTGDRGDLSSPSGDLGVSVPMSRPSCDGRGIVVLYSAVTPGAYAEEISAALTQFPGASYLRTDMACPSLRARDENGNVIYAVYRPSGYSQQELCADVRAAGPPAYGRWLDYTSDPSTLVTC